MLGKLTKKIIYVITNRRVLIATVKKDDAILVLEAMKMDNDITAPCDGVVRFQVAKGANVETDSVLAVIE